MRRSMVLTLHGTPYRMPRPSKVYKSNGKREVARRLRQQAKINARQQEQ